MKELYIKWLCLCAIGVFLLTPNSQAQDIQTPIAADLPVGAYIKGVYHLAPDDQSGLYLKEENGSLITASFDQDDAAFYFWFIENAFTGTFQMYTGRQGRALEIQTGGNTLLAPTNDAAASQLLFQMYPEGPVRDNSDATTLGQAFIITQELDTPDNTTCQCNVLQVAGNARFKVLSAESSLEINQYRPIAFEKIQDEASGNITPGDNATTIDQPTLNGLAFQNYVSSNFYVKGFGTDDFQVTIQPGTEGEIGFLHYTHHHYTKDVFANAKPQIGLKVENDQISLFYLAGEEPLPLSTQGINHEVVTNFVPGQPITFGFEGQDKLVAKQNSNTFALEGAAPAEFFFNQSITQSARLIIQLNQGSIEIGQTTKNFLINSDSDVGNANGEGIISTNPYLPYNEGRSLVNTFDWQKTKWDVRYQGDNGLVEERVFSPYHSSANDFCRYCCQL